MISIHRIVLRRLILAWGLVSLLAGGTIYIIEIAKIDDAIVALAASQARHFAPEGLDTGDRSQEELAPLREKAEEFVKRNFVVIELYDELEKRLFEVVNPVYEHIQAELKRFKHMCSPPPGVGPNLIAQPNFAPNTSPPPFNFGNPLGSPLNPNIVPDFGGNLSVDIIPVSKPGSKSCNQWSY